jgi:hypothetical protein
MKTDEELRAMAERIAAEFVSLELAADEIEESGGWRYVPLDAFLLHARKLRDFFRPRDSQPEDAVVADEYVRDVEAWRGARDRLTTEWLDRTRGPVNEKLAGFRWAAAEGDPPLRWKGWLRAVPHLRAELEAHWDIFVWAVGVDVREWFLEAYRNQIGLQRDWRTGPSVDPDE